MSTKNTGLHSAADRHQTYKVSFRMALEVTQSKPKFGVRSAVNRITNMKVNAIQLSSKGTGSVYQHKEDNINEHSSPQGLDQCSGGTHSLHLSSLRSPPSKHQLLCTNPHYVISQKRLKSSSSSALLWESESSQNISILMFLQVFFCDKILSWWNCHLMSLTSVQVAL